MAQKMTVQLVDDLTGEESGEDVRIDTVPFGLDGISYEIDLTEGNQARLRETLSEFVGHARKVNGKQSAKSARVSSVKSESEYDAKAVRAWAAANSVEVPARGRIPKTVLDQYRQAGN